MWMNLHVNESICECIYMWMRHVCMWMNLHVNESRCQWIYMWMRSQVAALEAERIGWGEERAQLRASSKEQSFLRLQQVGHVCTWMRHVSKWVMSAYELCLHKIKSCLIWDLQVNTNSFLFIQHRCQRLSVSSFPNALCVLLFCDDDSFSPCSIAVSVLCLASLFHCSLLLSFFLFMLNRCQEERGLRKRVSHHHV